MNQYGGSQFSLAPKHNCHALRSKDLGNKNGKKTNAAKLFVTDSTQMELVEYTYKYLREKVNNVPLFGKDADIFFAYIHVTKKVSKPNPLATSKDDAYCVSTTFEEKRVIHYHVPKEDLPSELKVINKIAEGEWSYELTEAEYLELIDGEKTTDVEFITYGLDKRKLFYICK